MLTFKIAVFLSCFLFCLNLSSFAQDTVRYSVTFPNAIHHECEISVLLTDIPDGPLQIVMSNSSPGRYANHLFAKNVDRLSAFSIEDQPLEITRVEPNVWIVDPENNYVKITYTLFANYPDGTYSGIDRNFALFNMPSAFIWFEGLEYKPIRINFEFHPDRNWKVATQLKQLNETSFSAPDLDYFMDSPTILSAFDEKEFSLKNGKKQEKFNLVYNPATDEDLESQFTDMVKKVVLEQKEIFGEFPDYDYGEYTFLGSFSKAYHGDGMEHRNSTMITQSVPLKNNEMGIIGTYSHEFFHCWNVERIRPKSLEPFDFTKANVSSELWFAEGFTSYYGPLTLFRCGIYDTTEFLQQLSGMLNYVLNSPGTGKNSLTTMSEMSPFVDAAVFIDNTNFKNTFTSYYPYGAMIGLALDLTLRTQFSNVTLDDLMKFMWTHYGKTAIPYTNDNLINALAIVTNDESFASSFFDAYIFGLEVPDYKVLLRQAGYELVALDSNRTDLKSTDFIFMDGKVFYNTLPLERSTFYVVGLDKGDEIISMNNQNFSNEGELKTYFDQLNIGSNLRIKFSHFGKVIETVTLVKPNRIFVIRDVQRNGVALTEKQQQIRSSWLKSRSNP